MVTKNRKKIVTDYPVYPCSHKLSFLYSNTMPSMNRDHLLRVGLQQKEKVLSEYMQYLNEYLKKPLKAITLQQIVCHYGANCVLILIYFLLYYACSLNGGKKISKWIKSFKCFCKYAFTCMHACIYR